MKKVLALSGSIRKDSSNWKILQLIKDLYKDRLYIELYEGLAYLPHFDPDLKGAHIPDLVHSFYNELTEADGLIVCTPEYVFSPPAILKNALEWTVAETILSYKPTALIVASSAGDKTFESLSLILKTLIQEDIPEKQRLLIRGVRAKLDDNGTLNDEGTINAIRSVVDALNLHIIEKQER